MATGDLSPEELFEGHPDALAAFAAVREVIDELGDHTVAVSKRIIRTPNVQNHRKSHNFVVGPEGLEPSTRGLKVRCSTN